jgi:hypothetical protein
MDIINLLAFITSVMILVKAIVMLVKPKGTTKVISRFMKGKKQISYVYFSVFLILTILVLGEMSLSQLMVGLLLASLLMGGILYSYEDARKELDSFVKKAYEKTEWWVLFILIVFALVTIFSIIF